MLDWLSTYILPGRVFDPCDGPRHAAEAESLGLGAVWVSDRWDQKEAGAMLGAVANATDSIRFGTAATHPHTRHPLALAGMATTLQALSHGRFTLGLGRSAGGVWPNRGLASPTTEMLFDIAVLLRKMWAGERVSYDGPLGTFPALQVTARYDGPPPVLALAAMGPRTLEVAGSVYDEVILHPFLTTESVERSAQIVRASAARAGRDPTDVKIVATVAVAPGLSPDRSAAVVTGRLITYLQAPGLGELIVQVNGWDPAVLIAVREHPKFADLGGRLADWAFTLEELAGAADVVPSAWVDDGAAVGSVEDCAIRIEAYRSAGADGVLLHGSSPTELAGLVDQLHSDQSAVHPTRSIAMNTVRQPPPVDDMRNIFIKKREEDSARRKAPTGDEYGLVLDNAMLSGVVRVARTAFVTPHLKRITLTGAVLVELGDRWEPGLDIRCLFPPDGYETGPEGPVAFPPEVPLRVRTYTVRRWNQQACELDVDIVVHGDAGIGSRWAASAGVGDRLAVALRYPEASPRDHAADWYLIAGDETAVPVIGSIIETLPPDASAYVFLEVGGPEDEQSFETDATVTIEWVHRVGEAGTSTCLQDAVCAFDWPSGTPFVWATGEVRSVTAIRKYIRQTRGLSRHDHKIQAYWRRGLNEAERLDRVKAASADLIANGVDAVEIYNERGMLAEDVTLEVE